MRKPFLEYFRFKLVKQSDCCSICDKDIKSTENVLFMIISKKRFRELPSENMIPLEESIKAMLLSTQETLHCFSMIDVPVIDISNMTENIMDGI